MPSPENSRSTAFSHAAASAADSEFDRLPSGGSRDDAEFREVEDRLRILFDHAPDGIVMLDVESTRFIDVNRAAEKLFGLSRDELLKIGPFELSPKFQPGGLSSELGAAKVAEAANGGVAAFTWWHVDAQGRRFPCDVHLMRVPWQNRTVIRGSIVDTSKQMLLELSEFGHSTILQQIVSGTSLEDALSALVQTMESRLPGTLCSVLLLDAETQRLHLGAAPSLPAFYNQAVEGLEIGPMVGSCGAAAYSGKRVIVGDVSTHANWADFHEIARSAQIRACWSEPILSPSGQVLGTFAMYYREPGEPAPVELRAIETAARLTAVAIELIKARQLLQQANANLERRVAEETEHLVEANERLRKSEQELRLAAVAFDVHDSIVITDRNGKILRVNRSFTQLTGYAPEEVIGKTPRVLRSGRHNREFYDKMWHAIRTDGFWEGEVWNRHKHGQEYLQRLTIACVRDEQGEITHFVANGQDLTRQKQAETDRAEILAASSVQRALLPKRFPDLPGLDIAGAVHPADCVSGDFFNVLSISPQAAGIVVADVSGHGLASGLVMSQMQAHLQLLTENQSDPGELLTQANEILSRSSFEQFVTAFLACLNTHTRTLVYAAAGHQGYLLRADGDMVILKSTGFPLGIHETWAEPSSPEIELHPGDILLVPTDGIEEAWNSRRECFGRGRMFDLVRRNATQPADQIVEALFEAAREFADGTPQADDITAVVVKVLDTEAA